jgi:hypothetical protein
MKFTATVTAAIAASIIIPAFNANDIVNIVDGVKVGYDIMICASFCSSTHDQ